MAPGLVDDAETKRALMATRRCPGHRRALGAPRCRALRDRWACVDCRSCRRRDRKASSTPRTPSARSSWRRSTSMGGSCATRCAIESSHLTRAGSARVPVAIGVASGEGKVRPILGALRAGVVRTLVTDVATAEAVVALDEATLVPAGGRNSMRSATMSARPPAILGIDLGTNEVKAGLVRTGRDDARTRPKWLFAGRVRWSRLGRAGPRELVVGGRHRGPSPPDIGDLGGRRHRRRRPRTDARRRRSAGRGDQARDHVPRHAQRERGRGTSTATGVLGWGLGGLPAALWVERNEPADRRGHLLVPLDLGVAGVSADRSGGGAARAGPGPRGSHVSLPTPASRSTSCHRPPPRAPSSVAHGSVRRGARSPARDTGRRRHGRCLRQLSGRRDSWNRATRTIRAAQRAGSASTGIVRSLWPADS